VNDLNNTTGVIIFIVFCVAFVYIKHLLNKGVHAAATVVNQKVLFKNEYNDERQMISESLIFLTTASIQDIMSQIKVLVNPTSKLNALKFDFYELERTDNILIYSYQNSSFEHFVVILRFEIQDNRTHCTFDFLRWSEQEGMLLSGDYMKLIRKRVQQAIEGLDPKVEISIVATQPQVVQE
jgi:hypothetical protein